MFFNGGDIKGNGSSGSCVRKVFSDRQQHVISDKGDNACLEF